VNNRVVPTTTSLATSANPAAVGLPVTFTATVAASTGTAAPAGLVVFVDRWELIGVVTLDSTGHAALPNITLTAGLHLIRAVYLGAESFLSSRSPRLYELIRST
jgi:Bacterial Ig-like domain (group 3)